MENSFCSHPSCSTVITMEFCSWYDSCAVVACAKFCSNMILYNAVTLQQIIHRKLNYDEKIVPETGPRTKDLDKSLQKIPLQSMVWCKTSVTPVPKQWGFRCVTLKHQYLLAGELWSVYWPYSGVK